MHCLELGFDGTDTPQGNWVELVPQRVKPPEN